MAKETNDKKDLQKIVDESVINAVAAASGNLKGDSYDSFAEAVKYSAIVITTLPIYKPCSLKIDIRRNTSAS